MPYRLAVDAVFTNTEVRLDFLNDGTVGVVYHVYDRLHLDKIPRRFTVEPGKRLDDVWALEGGTACDLWVLGPNGFVRHVVAQSGMPAALPRVRLRQMPRRPKLAVELHNPAPEPVEVRFDHDAYGTAAARRLMIGAAAEQTVRWDASASYDWYDFTILAEGLSIRSAGRIEHGANGVSDPLMATTFAKEA